VDERATGDGDSHTYSATVRNGASGCWRVARVLSAMLACCAYFSLCASSFGASVLEGSVSVSRVTSSGAALHAVLDPEGLVTRYRAEIVRSTESFEAAGVRRAPTPEGTLAPGAPSEVTVPVTGLSPQTAYRYRFVVTAAPNAPVASAESPTMTTQAEGGEFTLPDGRSWELVSPINKHGAGLEPLSREGGVIQAAASGDSITYVATAPPVAEPEGNTALEYAQILSDRQTQGWATQDITPPNSSIAELIPGEFAEYPMFSEDLSEGLVVPKGITPLPPLPADAEKTVYLRNSQSGAFKALVTAQNVIPGAVFGDIKGHNLLEVVGASPDLSHVVMWSQEALTEDAAPRDEVGDLNLYEWSDGKVQLASILPATESAPEESTAARGWTALLGNGSRITRNAVSADGSRVVFSTESFQGEEVRGEATHLYLRDTSKHETLRLDVPDVSESGAEEGPVYQGASRDGSRIFFTDERRLTPDAHALPSEPDLYVFELAPGGGKLEGMVTDLSKTASPSEAAHVRGDITGYSEDGTSVYFVASGSLNESAVPGFNLYLEHRGTGGWDSAKLVAAVSFEDAPDWAQAHQSDLSLLTARVSPSGRYAVFMSSQPLTGYDNRSAAGAPEQEVFRFDAATGGLVCVSCDPTGERPVGIFDGAHGTAPLVDHAEASFEKWISGNVPGWTAYSVVQAFYQSRYLNDAGDVYFNSADALVPADVNGKEDVYEYEPESPTCGASTGSSSETRVSEGGVNGCLSLISSGTSEEESAFLDASSSGDNVFFLTATQLVGRDKDSAFDVYDAHVCSATVPCSVAAVEQAAPCADADSCKAAAVPPATFVPPTSQVFGGEELAVRPLVTRPPLTRAQKLARALRVCRREHPRRRRRACGAAARHAFGARKTRKGGTASKSGTASHSRESK
jgi:hypothetical protein